MASGLPVVMTNDPSYARYLEGVGNGVRLVPPAPAAIARTLEALVGDSETRADAAQAVLEHARSAFTWEQAALRHERLYENLLAARRLPGESLQLAPADAKPVAAQATTASERGAMP